jgi:hypothetical protein
MSGKTRWRNNNEPESQPWKSTTQWRQRWNHQVHRREPAELLSTWPTDFSYQLVKTAERTARRHGNGVDFALTSAKNNYENLSCLFGSWQKIFTQARRSPGLVEQSFSWPVKSRHKLFQKNTMTVLRWKNNWRLVSIIRLMCLLITSACCLLKAQWTTTVENSL